MLRTPPFTLMIPRGADWNLTVQGWRGLAVAAGLGVLSAFALPQFCFIPLLLVCVPGLLFLVGSRRSWRGAALIGFWFGFGHHLIGLYWITEAILLEAALFWWLVPLAVPALATVLALFVAAACAIARLAAPGWRRALALAAAWVLSDLARQFIATGFPWNLLGTVWAMSGKMGDVLLQPASLVGAHGLTLVTLLLASTPLLGRRAIAGALAVMLAWVSFGVWRLQSAPKAPATLAVVLVQGNIPEPDTWDRNFRAPTFDRYLTLTRTAVAQTRDGAPGIPPLIVWPEAASPYLLDVDPAARAAIADAAGPGTPVLAGSMRLDTERRVRNSRMAIMSAGTPQAVADKWPLVPFGEYQPSWFPLPIQVVPGGGFAFGAGPQTLHVPGLPALGPLICYEAIFPGQVIDERDRPALMVNVTNDAWFGDSTGPRQHLAAARLRAVEEGLPLVRAANTGISAAFDRTGRELGRLEIGASGVLLARLSTNAAPRPLAARIGLAGPAVLALLCLTIAFARTGSGNRHPWTVSRDL